MKKTVISIIVFMFLCTVAFSLEMPLSAGFGAAFGFNYDTLKSESSGGEYKQTWSSAAAGGTIFIDFAYFKFDLKFYGSSISIKSNPVLSEWTALDQDYKLVGGGVGIGLFGKIPFNVSDKWKIFPTIGIQFDICTGLHFAEDYTPYDYTKKGDSFYKGSAWNSISLKGGIGADFEFTDRVFVRGELLFDFRFPSALDTEYVKAVAIGLQDKNTTNLNLGFSFNLAIGFRIAELGDGRSAARNRGSRRGGEGSRRGNDDDIYYPK